MMRLTIAKFLLQRARRHVYGWEWDSP